MNPDTGYADAPTGCIYCGHADPDCGFCEWGKPLDTQADWDASWGLLRGLSGSPEETA